MYLAEVKKNDQTRRKVQIENNHVSLSSISNGSQVLWHFLLTENCIARHNFETETILLCNYVMVG